MWVKSCQKFIIHLTWNVPIVSVHLSLHFRYLSKIFKKNQSVRFKSSSIFQILHDLYFHNLLDLHHIECNIDSSHCRLFSRTRLRRRLDHINFCKCADFIHSDCYNNNNRIPSWIRQEDNSHPDPKNKIKK
jgi:hypothetical protein